jgi:hypothetical protein
MTDETKTEPPMAPGLDEWHAAHSPAVDKEAAEEAAVLAENFQQERALRYVLSEGREDIGGFISPSLVGGGRQINWRAMPRGRNWM